MAQREAFDQALAVLLADPFLDGERKIAPAFPIATRTYAFAYGTFNMTYTFDSSHSLLILVPGVARYPNLP